MGATVESTVPSRVELADPDSFRGRFEMWQLEDLDLLRQQVNSGQRLLRTAAQASDVGPPIVSFSLQEHGSGYHETV